MALAHTSIRNVASHFRISGSLVDSSEIETGLINSTYLLSYRDGADSTSQYILQRININVFHAPHAVMHNVKVITEHIAKKSESPENRVLRLLPTTTGDDFLQLDDDIWRCYNFIEGCVTYDIVETAQQAYQAAYAFGTFQNLISDIPVSEIKETIPHFHDTQKRYDRLMQVAGEDVCMRASSVQVELEKVKLRKGIVSKLLDLRDKGELPVRVTHNDTKLNNVMMDAATDEAVCVIDLDTVMPGLALYDFGDLVRTAVSSAGESATDLESVNIRIPIFKALVDGYLIAFTDISKVEKELLIFSGTLISLEVAIRFLTDYLEGDVYFKTTYEKQNLDRARMHLKLVEELEKNEAEMSQYVETWQ